MIFYYSYSTKIGRITIAEQDGKIVSIDLQPVSAPAGAVEKETPTIKRAATQLNEYMAGRRTEFDLPLAFDGTKFQTDVWRALLKIPFGKMRSYGGIAAAVGRPRAVRAVGNAVGKNPIPIVIPCHRVIAAGGKIGGFSSGLGMKQKLLSIEKISVL